MDKETEVKETHTGENPLHHCPQSQFLNPAEGPFSVKGLVKHISLVTKLD